MDIEGFKTRLKKIMYTYGHTPSSFAEAIGVQRSIISHIMSERNKPSLEFVLKITRKFTNVKTDWLLHGGGDLSDEAKLINEPHPPVKEAFVKPVINADTTKMQETTGDKTFKQIIVLYTDNTFDVYRNS